MKACQDQHADRRVLRRRLFLLGFEQKSSVGEQCRRRQGDLSRPQLLGALVGLSAVVISVLFSALSAHDRNIVTSRSSRAFFSCKVSATFDAPLNALTTISKSFLLLRVLLYLAWILEAVIPVFLFLELSQPTELPRCHRIVGGRFVVGARCSLERAAAAIFVVHG
jgi:hypothetical protein